MAMQVTRRELLRMLGFTGAGALLAACQPRVIRETTEVEKVVKETVVVEGTPKVVEQVVTATPAPESPKVITYVESAGFGVPQYQEIIDPIAAELSRKMQSEGLNLELRVLVLDDPATEYQLLYAAGEEFTFAFDAPWFRMLSLRDQGYLRPLENLVWDYPNIVEAITEEVILYNYMLGHLYGLPTGYYVSGLGAGTVMYRQDIAEKYGMYPLKTLDELEAFLIEVRDNEPEMIPFGCDPTFNAFYLSGWWDWYTPWNTEVTYPYGSSGGTIEDPLRGKLGIVTRPELQNDFRARAEKARRWYEMDLVNKNMLQLLDTNVHEEFFNPGKCAAMAYNEAILKAKIQVQPSLQSYVPGAKAAGMDTFETRQGGHIGWGALKQWNFQVFNSNAALQDTLDGLAFFDWLLGDQDNIDIWLFGIEGVNYKKVEGLRYEDLPDIDATRNYRRRWYVAGVPGRFERVPADADEEFLEALAWITNVDNFLPNPLEKWDADRKVVEAELAQMQAAEQEAIMPIRAGQLPVDEAIANYTKMLDDANRQEINAVFQEQLDEWISENAEWVETGLEDARAKFEAWEKGPHAQWLAQRKP